MKATIDLPDHIIQHLIDYEKELKQGLHDLGGRPFVEPGMGNRSVDQLIEEIVISTALERRKYLDELHAHAVPATAPAAARSHA